MKPTAPLRNKPSLLATDLRMQLVRRGPEHLASYVAATALEREWSADNERGVEAAREELWSDDSAVALVTLEERSGPWDIFLFELRDGKVVC